MCVTCGCSDEANVTLTNMETGVKTAIEEHHHTHTLPDGTVITHSHHHQEKEHHQTHSHTLTEGTVVTHTHTSSTINSPQIHAQIHAKTISLEEKLLQKNDLIAAQNRGWFKGRNVLALNLVSSPGSGKTTLLTRTIKDLKDNLSISVIEGDQETANDAQKIRETGCKVVQINTGTGCHLEASMIERGYQELKPEPNSILMIENVGNLVCPALFDLGEYAKVAILSVTEGEDKPIKYPHMFRESKVMILTKIDLLPYVPFDLNLCLEYAKQVNPKIEIFQVSSLTGEGLSNWYNWLKQTLKVETF
ncbi:hydrogenase nickel incorporation protein HypB [Aphanothece sacrum]|uniref:Hydrogenase accessory protein HypB n=1 Tax=Aphanothece sacrum FPU1 TaxID=1920663 RepID=A0A401IHZ4_APHSA|nr:hydrogenase nickel incorporation protein HypB [Aphanothece sacrum]GBF80898.1 hydrogenase accessory protein HypB [Aphanothece sacrum FPU1]GBF85205.1 hydrogenase accessory protein HypB [Aphanothece sacrum FPU3]